MNLPADMECGYCGRDHDASLVPCEQVGDVALIQDICDAVFGKRFEVSWDADGESFLIGGSDLTIDKVDEGWQVTAWIRSGGTYYEPPDYSEDALSTHETVRDAAVAAVKAWVDNAINNMLADIDMGLGEPDPELECPDGGPTDVTR